MASYEIAQTYEPQKAYVGTANMPKPIRPEPESPHALRDLAEATGEYARAAEAFIVARDGLADARDRLDLATKVVMEVREKEGV